MPLQVLDTPNWPCNACSDCIGILNGITEFQQKIESTHHKLYDQIHRECKDAADSVCRLCLRMVYNKKGVSLFAEEGGLVYADQILEMLSIEVVDTPNWPKSACFECIGHLQRITWFQDQIVEMHKVLYAEMYKRDVSEPTKQEEELEETTTTVQAEHSINMALKDADSSGGFLLPQDLFAAFEVALSDNDDDFSNLIEYDGSGGDEDGDSIRKTALSTPKAKPNTVSKRKKKVHSSLVRRTSCYRLTAEEEELEALMVQLRTFECRLCSVDAKTLPGLQDHVRAGHDPAEVFICCDLLAVRTEPGVLYDHFRLHRDKEALKCPECGTRMKSSSGLKSHMKLFHPKGPFTITCDICGKHFGHKRPFERHYQTHSTTTFSCKYCGKGIKAGVASYTLPNKSQHPVFLEDSSHIQKNLSMKSL